MQNKKIALTATILAITIFFFFAGIAFAAQTCGNGIVEGTEQCDDESSSTNGTITYISNCSELQQMQDNLSGNYVLKNDIDCTETKNWLDPFNPASGTVVGFVPVGNTDNTINLWATMDPQPFTGTFNGNSYKITNLYETKCTHCGLFGAVSNAHIKNVIIENVKIDSTMSIYSGGLFSIAYNHSTIENCNINGDITGSSNVGGIGGAMVDSKITNSSFKGTVDKDQRGFEYVGGLIGKITNNCSSEITNCFATGPGPITGATYTGGLVGGTDFGGFTKITNSYSTFDVYGDFEVGGLVGWANGVITNSYATGNVKGSIDTGGLVGTTSNGAVMGVDCGITPEAGITKSFAKGNVEGGLRAGGLVGDNATTIEESFAKGNVSGDSEAGGLTGKNEYVYIPTGYNMKNAYSTGKVTLALVGFMAGGLIGDDYSKIQNTYSNGLIENTFGSGIGGLVGGWAPNPINPITCTSSYWNTTDSGTTTSNCGTISTQPAMKQQATYSGWDFANVWKIDPSINNGYPFLRFEAQTYYCGDGTCQTPFENPYNCPEDCGQPKPSQCIGQCLANCRCPTTPSQSFKLLSLTLDPNFINKTSPTGTIVNAKGIIKNTGPATNAAISLTTKDAESIVKTTDSTPVTTDFQENETKTVNLTFTVDDSWNGNYLITMQVGKAGTTTIDSSAAQILRVQPTTQNPVPEIPLAASGLFAIAALIIIALTKKQAQ